jgi:hypothetical protein
MASLLSYGPLIFGEETPEDKYEIASTGEERMRITSEGALCFGPCFLAPVEYLCDLPEPHTMNVGDVIYVAQNEHSYMAVDSAEGPRRWVTFSAPVPQVTITFTEPPALGRVVSWPADMKWPGQDERKILSSRGVGREYIDELRAELKLKRRNAGKHILSSRT